jgi:hypothetical protein
MSPATEPCLHCAISELVLREYGQDLRQHHICQVGQVIAQMIASIEDRQARAQVGSYVRREVLKMIDEAIEVGLVKGSDDDRS